MALIEWKPEFAVGVADVDHEHRLMIAMINDVAAMLDEGRNGPRVGEVLGEIHARIAAHFALEEKIMRELGYSGYAAHKADHERLLDEIRDIMDEYEDDRQGARLTLAAQLDEWFGVHFRTEDARLHRMPALLRSRGAWNTHR